jgi:transposase
VARCPACYRRVQGRHPEQTSDALGAAAVQFGPRLLGFAADLKHRLGVSYRKCSSVLLTLTGLAVAEREGPLELKVAGSGQAEPDTRGSRGLGMCQGPSRFRIDRDSPPNVRATGS